MGAREKLNGIHATAALLMAGVAGLVARSWQVFLLGAAVLLDITTYTGDIRPRHDY